ncbi:MAG: hypothetical protein JO002_06600, partial [Burkholderiaceae bacterium]|nr:hypothetical protein [Burkholderiaceae bacterium]
MTKSYDLALDIVPHFAENVLAKKVLSYGHYAKAAGRDSVKDSMAVGQAMHIIGAACTICQIPIAPLYYVKRADGEWRGVFESDVIEHAKVLPHYDLLYVTAREYEYSATDFKALEAKMRKVIPRVFGADGDDASPHKIWHVV